MIKKVLVTGGAGFLGSHLCDKLIARGYYVICLDNLFTGNIDNIKNLIGNNNFKYINHDVTIPLSIECDEIYNLACPASPIHYQSDPIKTAKTSIYGAVNMLDLSMKNNAKILQASTSEVYGNPTTHPQDEDYWGNVNPIGIRSCYDEGKRAAETFFMDYHRKHNIDIKIMRIFNTYGPRMSIGDGRVVSNFIVQALKGEDLVLYGDGFQTRSFCYIDDLINAMIILMNSDKGITGPINVGNPEEVTILELAKLIIVLTKSKSKIAFEKLPLDDPKQRKPNIRKAIDFLGWKPSVSLSEGLNKTIDYYKEILKINLDDNARKDAYK